MLGTSPINSGWNRLWSRRNIIICAIGWCLVTLGIYVCFGGLALGEERPMWYRWVTSYGLEDIPIAIAALLCLRNAFSKRIPSGSGVWLLMGLALLSFLLGSVLFTGWELFWNLNPTGCLGDPFFVIFYVLILIAMGMAIAGKRIRLNIYQWGVLSLIALYASFLAHSVVTAPVTEASVTPLVLAAAENPPEQPSTYAPTLPSWVVAADITIKPFGQNLNLFYIGCDISLFCMSAMVMFACWGGKLSKAWQLNALAVFCIYVSDMWYAYASNHIPNYQAGYIGEVGWVFGVILFGIAAATEFEQSQRRTQRQQATP
jgi:hypothetical protein